MRLENSKFRKASALGSAAFALFCLCAFALPAHAARDKIIKVLPQYLDLQGRHTITPSLYDRDAYQARLRRNPKERSGLRFMVNWKAGSNGELKMRVEMRGSKEEKIGTTALQANVRHIGGFSKWTELALKGEPYQNFGELMAWRVTLWDGEKLIAEEKSFLW
jgi:hypothetical protein